MFIYSLSLKHNFLTFYFYSIWNLVTLALPIESQTLQKLHTIRPERTYNEEECGPLIPHHNNTSNTY